MDCELSRPYLRVRNGEELSYGGSQNWFFEDKNFQDCGCGVVACADTLLYLRGREELTRDEYTGFVRSIRQDFLLFPGRGIDGLRLAWGLNSRLRAEGAALRASWCFSGARFWRRLTEQLSRDLPAVVSVGPCLPNLWGKDRVTLYTRTPEGACSAQTRIRSHFLAVTGLDGEWMRVSSWGRELYIRRADYDRYRRAHGAALTNLLYLREK